MTPGNIAWQVWACVFATPLMISTGQILFKIASGRLGNGANGFVKFLVEPVFLAALALYGVTTFVWIYALRALPLSYAYPFMALSFCIVPLASMFVFGESLTPRYWVGLALIVSGMLVINS